MPESKKAAAKKSETKVIATEAFIDLALSAPKTEEPEVDDTVKAAPEAPWEPDVKPLVMELRSEVQRLEGQYDELYAAKDGRRNRILSVLVVKRVELAQLELKDIPGTEKKAKQAKQQELVKFRAAARLRKLK